MGHAAIYAYRHVHEVYIYPYIICIYDAVGTYTSHTHTHTLTIIHIGMHKRIDNQERYTWRRAARRASARFRPASIRTQAAWRAYRQTYIHIDR